MKAPINQTFRMSFVMNRKGFGDLILTENGDAMSIHSARSGSIDREGKLQNCISCHTWYLIAKPESPIQSEYDRMCILEKPGKGWKWRLWPMPSPVKGHDHSSFLIHPDGGLGGSLGCIVTTDSNAMDLAYFGKLFFSVSKHTIIAVDVEMEEE